jgi:hypothetical protein
VNLGLQKVYYVAAPSRCGIMMLLLFAAPSISSKDWGAFALAEHRVQVYLYACSERVPSPSIRFACQGAPSSNVTAAFYCTVFAICVSCNSLHCQRRILRMCGTCSLCAADVLHMRAVLWCMLSWCCLLQALTEQFLHIHK